MRITLVISTLGRAGAERVACMLASAWVEQGKEVSVLTLDDTGTPAYPLDARVKVRALGLQARSDHLLQGLLRNMKRIRVLRRAIRESAPDIVVSSMDATNVLTLLATRRLGRPVVVCEHIDPSRYKVGAIWDRLRRRYYPQADALVCLTKSMLDRFQEMSKVRGWVIPDVIATPPPGLQAMAAKKAAHPAKRVLVGMGRLVSQKGFDLLLKAFASVARRHPEWQVKILGTGPLRAEFEQQAKSSGLSGRVEFLGEVADPFPILCNADLFVFSSRFEGFGLALCEAMACGLPAISFDCPSGPADIVRHGVDGILVPPEDVDALAKAMDRLMSDDNERARLAARAPEVLDRFSTEKTLAAWQQLFDDLSNLPRGAAPAEATPSTDRALGNDAN